MRLLRILDGHATTDNDSLTRGLILKAFLCSVVSCLGDPITAVMVQAPPIVLGLLPAPGHIPTATKQSDLSHLFWSKGSTGQAAKRSYFPVSSLFLYHHFSNFLYVNYYFVV